MDKKIIKKEFLDSLKLGTGKSYLLQTKYSQIDFSNEIIKGSITNFAIDPQCEGSRAKYIYRLIKKAKYKNKIINKILNVLENEKDDYYGLNQMCDLAAVFYKNGYTNSLKSLNIRFEKNLLDDYELCGEEQIITLEGINGVLKVANLYGKLIIDNKDNFVDYFIIDEFHKKNKSIGVYNILENEGQKNQNIKAFYSLLLENKASPSRVRKIKKYTYEIIMKKINEGRMYINEKRAKDLPDFEVIKLANNFISSKDNKEKELYLRFFRARKFPLDYNYLFNIVKKGNPKGTRLKYFALESLKYFKEKKIRNWAIEKIKKLKKPSEYLCLLSRNYQSGDYKLLNDLINKSNNYDYIHSLIFGIREIFSVNKTSECKEPLELIYHKMNCGIHRYDVVKILYENNVLNDNIFNEMKYDSEKEVNKLYSKIKKT